MSELDEYGRALDAANRHLETYSSVLEKNISALAATEKAEKDAADKEKKAADQLKKLGDGINTVTQNLLSFAQTLTSGNAFSTFKSAVGGAAAGISALADNLKKYGGAVKGIVNTLSGTTTIIIDAFEKAYGTFEKLSEVGAVSTFTDMKQSADNMQLNFQQAETLLTKHSKDLALWGGSVSGGRKEFEKVAASSYNVRKDFQRLGIGTEQFADFQLSYISQQLRLGTAQKADTDELIKETISYIDEIDAISKVYGQSRKDIQAQRQKRLDEVGFATWMRTLGKEQQRSATIFSDMVRGMSGSDDFTAKLNKMMQNGFQAVDEGTRSLHQVFIRAGVDVRKVQKLLATGKEDDALAASQYLQDMVGNLGDDVAGLAAMYGDKNFMTANQAAINEIRAKKGVSIVDAYKEAKANAAKHKVEQDTQNAKLADSMQAIETVKRNFDQLATNQDWATKAMNSLTDAMELFTEQFLKDSGQKLPETMVAKKELRSADVKVQAMQEEYDKYQNGTATDIFGRKLNEQTMRVFGERAKKELEAAQKEQQAARQRLNEAQARSGNATTSIKSYGARTREATQNATYVDPKTKKMTKGFDATVMAAEAALPQDTTSNIPTPTVGATPSAPNSNSTPPAPPSPTAKDSFQSNAPTRMRTGGMINASGVTPSGFDDVDTDSSVSTRSLNTSLFNADKTDVKFEDVYDGISRKLDQLISLMSSTAKEKKKQMQMKSA